MSVIEPLSVFSFFALVLGICWSRPVVLGLVGMAKNNMAKPAIRVQHVRAYRTFDFGYLARCPLADSKMTCEVCGEDLTSWASFALEHVVVLYDVFHPTLTSWALFLSGGSSCDDLGVIGVNGFLLLFSLLLLSFRLLSFLLSFLLVTSSKFLFFLKSNSPIK